MKKFIKSNKVRLALLIVLASLLSTSCHKDYFGNGGSKPELRVERLTDGLEGENIDALSVDLNGNVYASQFGRFEGGNGDGTIVYKTQRDGSVSEFITDLSGPLGNIIDAEGNFYVVHNNGDGAGDVLKITTDGVRVLLATIEGFPSGLTLDEYNNLYVANFVSPTIHRISSEGESSVYATDDRLAGVVGIDFDSRGNLIAGNFSTSDILSINTKNEVTLITDIPELVEDGSGIGYLTVARNTIFATGIDVDKIYSITFDGVVSHFAGSGEEGNEDEILLEATFNSPNGIIYDEKYNTLYISEYNSPSIRSIKLY